MYKNLKWGQIFSFPLVQNYLLFCLSQPPLSDWRRRDRDPGAAWPSSALFLTIGVKFCSRRQKVGQRQKCSLMCATKREVCTVRGSAPSSGLTVRPKHPTLRPHRITVPPSTNPPVRKVPLDQKMLKISSF